MNGTPSTFPFSQKTLERFRAKYSEGRFGCWEWHATTNRDGYGMVRVGGVLMGAHRASYMHHVGPIPPGLHLDHLCRNRACVNPAHLEPVTNAENVMRGVNPAAINARKTHCPRGHEYSGENLVLTKRGNRECRACHRREVMCELCGKTTTYKNRIVHKLRSHREN